MFHNSVAPLKMFGTALVWSLSVNSAAFAISLAVANASFEAPALADGVNTNPYQTDPTFANQGGHGWVFDVFFGVNDGGIWNPQESLYPGSADSGTPSGADGAQVGYAFRNGVAARQRLIGPDGVLGSSDDPLLTSSSTYTLSVSVGQRIGGGFGALAMQLLAGAGTGPQPLTVIAEKTITGGSIPAAGTFSDQQLVLDTATVNPSLYGQPLSIRLMQTGGPIDAAEFDNVRLEATIDADYNDNGNVDAADYTVWRDTLGKTGGGLAADGDGNLIVNGNDYDVWRSNFTGIAASGSAVQTLRVHRVPEPTSLIALSLSITFIAFVKLHRHRRAGRQRHAVLQLKRLARLLRQQRWRG